MVQLPDPSPSFFLALFRWIWEVASKLRLETGRTRRYDEFMRRGKQQYLAADWDGAIATYESAVAERPQSDDPWYSLALCYHRAGRYGTALTLAGSAQYLCRDKPQRGRLFDVMGASCLALSMKGGDASLAAESLEFFQAALALQPDSPVKAWNVAEVQLTLLALTLRTDGPDAQTRRDLVASAVERVAGVIRAAGDDQFREVFDVVDEATCAAARVGLPPSETDWWERSVARLREAARRQPVVEQRGPQPPQGGV